jgi:hypothetical protein
MPNALPLMLVALLFAPAGFAADARGSVENLPVAGTARVTPDRYAAAAQVAAPNAAPVEIALTLAGPFEGSRQYITQVNEGAEVPTGSRVTLIRDGLLDDSLRAERWEIMLDRASTGAWHIREVRRAWLCRRGAVTDRFIATPCP